MKIFIILVIAVAFSQAADFQTCERNFKKVGCYIRNKALLPTMLLNGREVKEGYVPESGMISWGEYSSYLHSLACECAKKAKAQDMKFFGIGFYGECFGGKDMVGYASVVSSGNAVNSCVRGTYAECGEDTVGDHECAGEANAEYIYSLETASKSDDAAVAVNGGYSDWSDWTECDQSCGEGVQVRERSCNNPLPENGGADCEELGESTETRPCTTKECPVDGGYSRWSDYSECTKTCGGGNQKRTRTCTNPAPMHDGKACEGQAEETQACASDACPINGKWSAWSSYGTCSKTCDRGSKLRTRTCTDPAPQNDGEACPGSSRQSASCNVGVRCPYYTAYHSNHACEGGSMKLWCTDKQQKIKLSEYWYGRQERHTCGGFFKYVWSLSCKYDRPSKVWSECQNKNSCKVQANNNWMGKDPCWGTHKYFQVKFRCYG